MAGGRPLASQLELGSGLGFALKLADLLGEIASTADTIFFVMGEPFLSDSGLSVPFYHYSLSCRLWVDHCLPAHAVSALSMELGLGGGGC